MDKLKIDLSNEIVERKLNWEVDEGVEHIRISTGRGNLIVVYSEMKNKYVIAYVYKDKKYKDVKDIEWVDAGVFLASQEYDEVPSVSDALDFMVPLASFGEMSFKLKENI